MAFGAAAVPVKNWASAVPVAGLEPNRGQTGADVLFLNRSGGMAVTAHSILFYPKGIEQTFLGSNPNPPFRFINTLPGVVNSFTGADSQKWLLGIPRYSSAEMRGIYPGVDATYTINDKRELLVRFTLTAGTDPGIIAFELTAGPDRSETQIETQVDGSLRVRMGAFSRVEPPLVYPAPIAVQQQSPRVVKFNVSAPNRFGFQVEGRDNSAPLVIELKLLATGFLELSGPPPQVAEDAEGNTFVAWAVPDAPGKPAPLIVDRGNGCSSRIESAIPCSDLAIYKFTKDSQLAFVTYVSGRTNEEPIFLGIAPDGTLVAAGSTDSLDFPTTATALQRTYAGPAANGTVASSGGVAGEYFATKVDAASGRILASTYLGGPNADRAGRAALGRDGSLYFLPKWLNAASYDMPVTGGALRSRCTPGEACVSGYVARLTPALDRLVFATYLPGRVTAAEVHSDGSVYYVGVEISGFPVTPGAYRSRNEGPTDGIVGRLDPSGSKLLFGTYVGGPGRDFTQRLAVVPDGSLWVTVSSSDDVSGTSTYRTVHLDAKGEKLLADLPMDSSDLATDQDGNLYALASGDLQASPNAILENRCPNSTFYRKLNSGGAQMFATYLPSNTWSEFERTSARGLPILRADEELYQIVESETGGVYAGCVADGATFVNSTLSPGAIVTFFGSNLGPREGVGFTLLDGVVPTSLAGTRVLVNGEPVPVLYASHTQVNAILPGTLPISSRPILRLESNGRAGNELRSPLVQAADISIFRLDGSLLNPAAALNEDGTVNSPQNPARKGSRVVLFGTGGGATLPPGVAGQVTPLETRPLEKEVAVITPDRTQLTVDYAGAAPGLLAGVIQINVKLPDTVPPLPPYLAAVYPEGKFIQLTVQTRGGPSSTAFVTVAVSPQ